jgi:hypothetical protein
VNYRNLLGGGIVAGQGAGLLAPTREIAPSPPNAVSMAGLLLTTEVMIAAALKDDDTRTATEPGRYARDGNVRS